MRKRLLVFLGLFIVFGIGGCKNVSTEVMAIYPRSTNSFVGDPMPYYNGEEFMMYYLEDLRDGQIGFHPFSLMTTKDFYHYEDFGEVIPFVNEEDSPERALGTGSIIQDDKGIYHAFYTGHNGERNPKEVIMHATSKDGVKWKKIPENTFEGDESYEKNDFRDPYVFWEEESQEYWMLITTRQDGKGIIAKYTSVDLETWENQGIFFENDLGNDSNLECPSLVEYNGKWYLAFSDQWDQRVVHYRVADHPSGPFREPDSIDHVDGAGFYAGRLETDGENLYLVGWIPTKESHDDRSNYNWAGNLAVHQLVPTGDHLLAKLPEAVTEQLDFQSFPSGSYATGEEIIVEGNLLKSEIEVTPETQIAIEIGTENVLLLDFEQEKMSYYNTFLDDVPRRNPQSEMKLNSSLTELMIVQEEGMFVIYDGSFVLSNRIYKSSQSFTLKVLNGTINFK